MMEIIKSGEIKGELNPKGISAVHLIRQKHVRVTKLMLEPGDILPAHDVPVDVFFYVVSGKGTLQIGADKADIEAQDMAVCPANTKMALWADRKESLVVLNVKTPNF
jgi:quercetin dioxygenase-like cupin family protein